MNTYKIVIVGDEGLGKTNLTAMLAEMPLMPNYQATLGVEVHPTRFNYAIFNLWDCAGKPAFSGLGAGYWLQSHGMIVVHQGDISETSIQKMQVFQAMNPAAKILAVNVTHIINRDNILNYFT